MGMEVGKAEGVRSDINVVPLIDIVLVLLIIFMVVTPMLQKGVAVELPVTENPEKQAESPDDVFVSIRADEKVLLSGKEGKPEELTDEQLVERLTELQERAPATVLFIKADKKLKYKAVKKVLLACEAAGFRGAALITKKPQSDEGG